MLFIFMCFMSFGVYHGIKLNHFLGRLADVWNQNPQVTIFNHGVKTKQQMYSDILFMNDLWQEKSFNNLDPAQAATILSSVTHEPRKKKTETTIVWRPP